MKRRNEWEINRYNRVRRTWILFLGHGWFPVPYFTDVVTSGGREIGVAHRRGTLSFVVPRSGRVLGSRIRSITLTWLTLRVLGQATFTHLNHSLAIMVTPSPLCLHDIVKHPRVCGPEGFGLDIV